MIISLIRKYIFDHKPAPLSLGQNITSVHRALVGNRLRINCPESKNQNTTITYYYAVIDFRAIFPTKKAMGAAKSLGQTFWRGCILVTSKHAVITRLSGGIWSTALFAIKNLPKTNVILKQSRVNHTSWHKLSISCDGCYLLIQRNRTDVMFWLTSTPIL